MDHSQTTQPVFLARNAPLIVQASAWLIDSFGPKLDCLTVVVPGGRANRLLLGELVALAESRALALIPPAITMVSALAGTLGAAPKNSAGDLARRLAWLQALQRLSPADLAPLICSPQAPDETQWARYARVIEQAADELAWGGLCFRDVWQRCASEPMLGDQSRWDSLAMVQNQYLRWLGEQNLVDPVLGCGVPDSRSQTIVLIGVLTLPTRARKLLEDLHVVPLVFAPEDERDGFDRLGLLRPDYWGEAKIRVDAERVVFADTPRDQSDAALAIIAGTRPDRYVDEVTIGLCDPSLAPHVERIAKRAGHVAVRSPAGHTIDRTPPFRLLRLVRDVLIDGSFDTMSALVRHPDGERAMQDIAHHDGLDTDRWIDTLDRYAERHIPGSLDEPWRSDNARTLARLDSVRSAMGSLLGELGSDSLGLAQIAGELLSLLDRAYGSQELDPNDPNQAAILSSIDAVVVALQDLASLDKSAELSPGYAINLLLDVIGSRPCSPGPDAISIEALGWLELLVDPAPVLVVTGFNEGSAPSPMRSNPFISDRVRTVLGLENEADRLARDAAIMRALCDSRESVHFVVGRRSASNDPLAPSRLLFLAGPEQTLLMASRWTSHDSTPRATLQRRVLPGQVSAFHPKPSPTFGQPTTFSITSFKTFLRSPYLFYLERLLRLDTRSDGPRELDPASFGTLLHDALATFGDSDVRDADDPDHIAAFLQDAMATLSRDRLGEHPAPALKIQRHFAEQTLTRFAEWQADRVRAGWRITHAEWPDRNDPEHAGVEFSHPDGPVKLKGRIDRIDRHETTGEIAILDYKASMNPKNPDTAHRASDGTWRDLQLPLYCHLARSILAGQLPTLAYVSMNAKKRDVRLMPLGCDEVYIQSAFDAARDVITQIRAGEIQSLERFTSGYYADAFGWIAGVAVNVRSEAPS